MKSWYLQLVHVSSQLELLSETARCTWFSLLARAAVAFSVHRFDPELPELPNCLAVVTTGYKGNGPR